jgi:hypothetical protein
MASLLAVALAGPLVAVADDPVPAPADAERQKLEAQIARELGASSPASTPVPSPGRPGGAAPWARLMVLPDISAIGSFAAVQDGYDVGRFSPREGAQGPSGKPTFLFQELELGLQAVIDPYFRADAFIAFTPGGASVEEAYLTTLALPAGVFTDIYHGEVFVDKLHGTAACQGLCARWQDTRRCPAKCECAYIREMMQLVKQWPKRVLDPCMAAQT